MCLYTLTMDWSGRRSTPGGSACALRPWTERSEGSGSSHALRKAYRLERKSRSTYYFASTESANPRTTPPITTLR